MGLFWKTAAGVILTVILVLAIGKQEKDLAVVLMLAVCCMTACAAFSFLEPVLDFLYRLEELAGFDDNVLVTLLKIAGVGIVAETGSMICQDSGNGALGRGLQLLGTAVVLYLSLPLLEGLLTLMQDILGEL